MNKVIIITGANRGLGKAIADYVLQDENALIISLSRSLHEDHKNINSARLIFIKTDLEDPFLDNFSQVINPYVQPNTSLYFFSNAGIILPIEKIGKFYSDAIEISIKVNVHYPVNMINYLLKTYNKNQIILINISSGAGKNPISNWALYCSAKAYMKMFFMVLEKELETDRVQLFTIDPGVLDTSMQDSIRSKEAPQQAYFQSLKEENKLIPPNIAASKIFDEINYKI